MTNKSKSENILREIREELSGILRTKRYLKVPKGNYKVIIFTEILYQRDGQSNFINSCFVSFPWKKFYLMK